MLGCCRRCTVERSSVASARRCPIPLRAVNHPAIRIRNGAPPTQVLADRCRRVAERKRAADPGPRGPMPESRRTKTRRRPRSSRTDAGESPNENAPPVQVIAERCCAGSQGFQPLEIVAKERSVAERRLPGGGGFVIQPEWVTHTRLSIIISFLVPNVAHRGSAMRSRIAFGVFSAVSLVKTR